MFAFNSEIFSFGLCSTKRSCLFYNLGFINIAKRRIFISTWVFFHIHLRFTEQQGKREAISLTTLYHFHPLQRYLDYNWGITAESSPLQIVRSSNQEPLISECNLLTTAESSPLPDSNRESLVCERRALY